MGRRGGEERGGCRQLKMGLKSKGLKTGSPVTTVMSYPQDERLFQLKVAVLSLKTL